MSGSVVKLDNGEYAMRVAILQSPTADGNDGGQATGAGAVSSGVQRVTLASDDPAVAGIGGIAETAGTSLFGYLVNGTTLTPQAVAHTVTITGYPI